MTFEKVCAAAVVALGMVVAAPLSGAQAAGGCSANPDMKNCTVQECQTRQSDVDFYCHDMDQVCSASNDKSDNQAILGALENCLSKRISVNACFSPVDPGHANAVVWVENQISNCEVVIGSQ
ncbi:hypothetical protein [Caenispirillum salinarum]|uniref:hypothetical protein n=1 Tax=Caenispirillum salinarum TaxID=859058 RepID=UPI00384CC14E